MFDYGPPKGTSGRGAGGVDELALSLSSRSTRAMELDLAELDAGEMSPGRKMRSRDRPRSSSRAATASSTASFAASSAYTATTPPVSARKSDAGSAFRGAQGVDLVLRAVLEELVLDEVTDATVEELQNNKWSKEKLTGWLRHGHAEFSSSALRSMIAECDRKEEALLRCMDNLVPKMWAGGGMFGSNVRNGKFGKKAVFV